MKSSQRGRTLLEASTEVVISILPLIVVLLVMFYIGKPMKLFAKPEWAFGAAIFFGQSLVKLLAAMTAPHRSVESGKVVLFAASVLVFGLAPSLLVLVFVIHSAEQLGTVPAFAQTLQVALFALSAFAFVVVAAVCHELAFEHSERGHDDERPSDGIAGGRH
jgi:hypothetical protein